MIKYCWVSKMRNDFVICDASCMANVNDECIFLKDCENDAAIVYAKMVGAI